TIGRTRYIAKERLIQVMVRVDKAREEDLARPMDHLISDNPRGVFPYINDPIPLDKDVPTVDLVPLSVHRGNDVKAFKERSFHHGLQREIYLICRLEKRYQ
ncbi:unnamed protein product, partial [marine sediment metagenome]